MLQDDVAELVRGGEALDVKAATGGHHDTAKRRWQAEPQRRGKRLEHQRNIEFPDRFKYVNQAGTPSHTPLQVQLAMHSLRSGNGV
jgi:hypothetical protein